MHTRIANANDLSLHNLHVSRLAQRIQQQLDHEGWAECCGVRIKRNYFSFRNFSRSQAPYKAWGGKIGPARDFDSVRDIASMIDEFMTRNDVIHNLQRRGVS
jgi:hypothetical protein